MNKILKGFIASLGAIDIVFSIFIPVIIALLLINLGQLSNFNAGVVIIMGILSSFYRAINLWIIE